MIQSSESYVALQCDGELIVYLILASCYTQGVVKLRGGAVDKIKMEPIYQFFT